MNILPALKSRFRTALAGLMDDQAEIGKSLDLIRRSQDPKFGDYQANMAMSLGKRLGRKPREVAAEMSSGWMSPIFANRRRSPGRGSSTCGSGTSGSSRSSTAAVGDPRLGVPVVEKPRTFVVDYSAPNVAKPMHVGHIRSTVIGDALCRMLKFLGHRVISDNHIGDWGTQFGMILYGYKHFLDCRGVSAKSDGRTGPALSTGAADH